MTLEPKHIFGMFTIGVVGTLQAVAWIMGHDGTIFATTSLIIGAVAGTILGFQYGKTK